MDLHPKRCYSLRIHCKIPFKRRSWIRSDSISAEVVDLMNGDDRRRPGFVCAMRFSNSWKVSDCFAQLSTRELSFDSSRYSSRVCDSRLDSYGVSELMRIELHELMIYIIYTCSKFRAVATLRHAHIKEPKMLSLDAFSRAQLRLTTGIHLDPLGELQRSPRPHSRMGPTSKGKGGKGEGKGGKRKGRERKGRRL